MRTVIATCVFLTGCAGIQESYRKGYDTSFMKSCIESAQKKGASETRAKSFCECALKKVNAGESLEKAASSCQ